eukprot:3609516-Alexandrium_andersonii.AAC.1
MRKCLRHSTHELHGPRNGLRLDPQRSGGVRSAPLFAQLPTLKTRWASGRAGGTSWVWSAG